MNNNTTAQQSLPKPKNISSLKLAIIILLLIIFGIIIFGFIGYLTSYMIISDKLGSSLGFFLGGLYYLGILVISIFGIIKSAKELKLQKGKLATAGMIFCIIDLLLTIIVGYYTVIIFIFLGT